MPQKYKKEDQKKYLLPASGVVSPFKREER